MNSNGVYGPVCDDLWDNSDAAVVCRQLGYSGGIATSNSYFGQTSSTFAYDNVACTGSEAFLQECPHLTVDNCASSEAAGVECFCSGKNQHTP